MDRKLRPYIFYDTTQSLCSHCMRTVQAHVIFKDEKVFLDKWCPIHGNERVLISDDIDYYKMSRETYIKKPELPFNFNTPMKYGCPYDCGLCPDHMQHSCLTVLEITDNCNIECPVCYADSKPQADKHKSFDSICRMLDTIVKNEQEPDIVQISGGEPTTHPDFWKILDEMKKRPIKHIMVNTNGINLANDKGFVEKLSQYKPGLEIYLQFDSFEEKSLKELRGANLTRIREKAIEYLNEFNISTTLVMTIKRGLNDKEIGKIIDYAKQQKCVRGVTIQPIQDAGRNLSYNHLENRMTISEIRREISLQSTTFSKEDIIPVPCNPDSLAMGYALKVDNQITPLTHLIPKDILISDTKNTVIFESDLNLKNAIFKLFSTNHAPEGQANCLSELMCCLPNVDAPQFSYDNVFRILIVQFMDAYSMDIRALKKSCIHIATEDKMIPFEAYNLFYRGNQKLLTEIRQEMDEFHQKRKSKIIPIHFNSNN